MGGRFDNDDPQDEHDINELRKYVHDGSEPQFAGEVKGSICSVITLAMLGVLAATGYGAWELIGVMSS